MEISAGGNTQCCYRDSAPGLELCCTIMNCQILIVLQPPTPRNQCSTAAVCCLSIIPVGPNLMRNGLGWEQLLMVLLHVAAVCLRPPRTSILMVFQIGRHNLSHTCHAPVHLLPTHLVLKGKGQEMERANDSLHCTLL